MSLSEAAEIVADGVVDEGTEFGPLDHPGRDHWAAAGGLDDERTFDQTHLPDPIHDPIRYAIRRHVVAGRTVPVQDGVVVALESDMRVRRGRVVMRAVLPDAPLLVDVLGFAAFDQVGGVLRRLRVPVVVIEQDLRSAATGHEFLERHHEACGSKLFRKLS